MARASSCCLYMYVSRASGINIAEVYTHQRVSVDEGLIVPIPEVTCKLTVLLGWCCFWDEKGHYSSHETKGTRAIQIDYYLLLQELMTRVESFQCEAQKVIQSGTTDVTRLQQLLDNGHTLDVELPEIPKLKQVSTMFFYTVVQ